MSILTVDYFATVDGFAYGEGSPAYFGLSGPGMFDWVYEQLDRDHIMLMGANTCRALSEIVAFPARPRLVGTPADPRGTTGP